MAARLNLVAFEFWVYSFFLLQVNVFSSLTTDYLDGLKCYPKTEVKN